jgi:hypothetical protein
MGARARSSNRQNAVIVNEHDEAWVDGPGAFTLGG